MKLVWIDSWQPQVDYDSLVETDANGHRQTANKKILPASNVNLFHGNPVKIVVSIRSTVLLLVKNKMLIAQPAILDLRTANIRLRWVSLPPFLCMSFLVHFFLFLSVCLRLHFYINPSNVVFVQRLAFNYEWESQSNSTDVDWLLESFSSGVRRIVTGSDFRGAMSTLSFIKSQSVVVVVVVISRCWVVCEGGRTEENGTVPNLRQDDEMCW